MPLIMSNSHSLSSCAITHNNILATHVATTLKKLRHQHGWSLDACAQKTGVSKAMLGQIEREESSPTISTLWKIASGFNIPFSSFTIDTIPHPTPTPHDNSILIKTLFSFDQVLGLEIFMITLPPHYTHLSPPHQAGVIEHVIALDGAIEVLAQDEWHYLPPQQGFRFAADQTHGYRNLSSQFASFHNVIHYTAKDQGSRST